MEGEIRSCCCQQNSGVCVRVNAKWLLSHSCRRQWLNFLWVPSTSSLFLTLSTPFWWTEYWKEIWCSEIRVETDVAFVSEAGGKTHLKFKPAFGRGGGCWRCGAGGWQTWGSSLWKGPKLQRGKVGTKKIMGAWARQKEVSQRGKRVEEQAFTLGHLVRGCQVEHPLWCERPSCCSFNLLFLFQHWTCLVGSVFCSLPWQRSLWFTRISRCFNASSTTHTQRQNLFGVS